MRKFYSLLMLLFFASQFSLAQTPTAVFESTECNFVRSFNTTNEGFSSPSIYSDDENTSFFWNAGLGAWTETSGLAERKASIISPVYLNPTAGTAFIGFRYLAPANTEYRIRIIAGVTGTQIDIVGTTANGPVFDPLPSVAGSLCLLLLDADIPAGPIRYEVTFRATVAFDMLFDDFALNVQVAQLPVTFLGFVAKQTATGNSKLLWDVADETDVVSYVVERSLNGYDFTSIGTVTATGRNQYSLEDGQKIDDTKYYRVKNVDIDGKFKYTPTIKVASKRSTGQIQIYPMPASAQVYIQHDKAPPRVTITIYTLDGKQVKTINAIPNTYQTSINIANLPSGMYIVKYNDGKGDVQSAKLIKN